MDVGQIALCEHEDAEIVSSNLSRRVLLLILLLMLMPLGGWWMRPPKPV